MLPYNVKHHILSLLYLENVLLSLGCSSNKICNALLWLMNGKYSDCDLELLSREILGKYHLPNKVKHTVYKTLFEPHLNYCNVIWCNTFPTHLLKLKSLQKKIIRIISWSDFDAHTAPLFHRYGLLRLDELNTYHNACLIFQVVNCMNTRLCNLIPISSPQHAYYTRNLDHIAGKFRRLDNPSLSVVCRGPVIWNDLPIHLCTHSPNSKEI